MFKNSSQIRLNRVKIYFCDRISTDNACIYVQALIKIAPLKGSLLKSNEFVLKTIISIRLNGIVESASSEFLGNLN